MQNIMQIKKVLDSFDYLVREYHKCEHPGKAEELRNRFGSAKADLLKAYDSDASRRFESLDPVLHKLFNQHFISLVLSVGELQEIHDRNIRSKHVDTDTFHDLRLTKIHPILLQIDQRLLAMNATLNGMSLVVKRNP